MMNGDKVKRPGDKIQEQEKKKMQEKRLLNVLEAKKALKKDQLSKKPKIEELDKIVNTEVDKLKKQKSEKLSDKFKNARAIAKDLMIETIDIPEGRKQFGIPNPDHPNKRYGGWKNRSGKPVDLYRGSKEKERPGNLDKKAKPIFYNILERLSKNAKTAEDQFENLKATPKGALTDVGLTLAIISHEGQIAIGSSSKKIDSYGKGGLDLFYKDQKRYKKRGFLSADFHAAKGDGGAKWPAKWRGRVYNELGRDKAIFKSNIVVNCEVGRSPEEAVEILQNNLLHTALGKRLGEKKLKRYLQPWKKKATQKWREWKTKYDNGGRQWQALLPSESKHEVFPAKIPQNRMIEAYGAVINSRFDRFKTNAERKGFSSKEIGNLNTDARRVWTTVYFSLPKQGRDLLNSYKREGKKLNDIVGDKKATKYDSVKRGLVNSLEAKLFDTQLDL